MFKGGDEFTRDRIPEFSEVVRACREDASTVGTKRPVVYVSLMFKGGDELPRGGIPKLGGLVRACGQNPCCRRD